MVENRQKPGMTLIPRSHSAMKINNGANFHWLLMLFGLF
jgi:hypothetical protein